MGRLFIWLGLTLIGIAILAHGMPTPDHITTTMVRLWMVVQFLGLVVGPLLASTGAAMLAWHTNPHDQQRMLDLPAGGHDH
jgi:hypothetical protein